MPEKEITLIDFLHILMKWRKSIIINVVAVCVLAAGISLILPKSYTATTRILPPEEQALGMGLSSLLANLPIGSGAMPGVTAPGGLYVAILHSRTVSEGVINKLDLEEILKSKNMERAIEKLREKTRISVSDEGVIELKAMARSPQLAADIANAFIAELDKKNTELNIAQARNNRLFIEKRLAMNKDDMRRAEEELKRFQEVYKAIALPEQTTAAIEAAATLMGEKQVLEVKRDVLLSTMTAANPQVAQIRTEIDALQKQLNLMEFGAEKGGAETDPEEAARNKELYVPFAKVPEVGLQLARLMREVKIQEVIFELLTQQYEQAKLQEARDTPTVQILDAAVAPILKSQPRRAIIVGISGLSCLLIMVVFAVLYERVLALKETDKVQYEKIMSLVMTARNDMTFRRRIKTDKRPTQDS